MDDTKIEKLAMDFFRTANKNEIRFSLGWMTIFKAGFQSSQPKEVKGGVVSEYQLCPKCFGKGWIPTTGGYQTATTEQCDVCYGAKTLIKPVVSPPESQSPIPVPADKELEARVKYAERVAYETSKKNADLIAEIEKLKVPADSGWVSVEDELPPECRIVITFHDTSKSMTTNTLYKGEWTKDINGLKEDITHWQPLPIPPGQLPVQEEEAGNPKTN
jgi:DnaJ-class molecular chaperone